MNMTIPMPTLLSLAERPGTASRIGTIDPAQARAMAAAAARSPASTWCITVTGPDGRPVAHGCARPAKTAKGAKGAKSPPGPGTRDRPAFTPDDDHGPPGDHDPPGPYGRWRLNPAALTGNPGGQDMIIDFEALDGPCDHRHQAAGHDPGVKLRHLTGVLNKTCTFPPCRRPAGAERLRALAALGPGRNHVPVRRRTRLSPQPSKQTAARLETPPGRQPRLVQVDDTLRAHIPNGHMAGHRFTAPGRWSSRARPRDLPAGSMRSGRPLTVAVPGDPLHLPGGMTPTLRPGLPGLPPSGRRRHAGRHPRKPPLVPVWVVVS